MFLIPCSIELLVLPAIVTIIPPLSEGIIVVLINATYNLILVVLCNKTAEYTFLLYLLCHSFLMIDWLKYFW